MWLRILAETLRISSREQDTIQIRAVFMLIMPKLYTVSLYTLYTQTFYMYLPVVRTDTVWLATEL